MSIQLPWDYSRPLAPGEGVPNLPSPEGAALGRELARMTENTAALMENPPTCCHDCAFRLGTPPNQCSTTLADALKCIMEGDTEFLCHVREGKLCAGYVIATAASTTPDAGGETG